MVNNFFKKELFSIMFYDHRIIKLEIKKRKIFEKSPKYLEIFKSMILKTQKPKKTSHGIF